MSKSLIQYQERAEGDLSSYDSFDGEYPNDTNYVYMVTVPEIEEELPFGDPFE